MKVIGVDTALPAFTTMEFYAAHECLLLPYEQSPDQAGLHHRKVVDCSAHMLWVGERTRQQDGAHFQFVHGVSNPLGVRQVHPGPASGDATR
ncbi:hypothetical protein TrCOL_g3753 [Triparma columacea]|uniref:Phospho-2-dehydro-3-deoxyheptonate aldolase n=1 Tax=Triparma columacea TaxID=722753 RepID=A0A9W7G565_9STRA|nr:hypothetical protein TrCOL_g3753 [Triparma columacea]